MRTEREMLSVTKTETARATQIMTGHKMVAVRMANIFSPIATGKRAAFATDSAFRAGGNFRG
jgi:hypothetical protein